MTQQHSSYSKDPEVNTILSRMWELNNLLASGKVLAPDEISFWNENLDLIKGYYNGAGKYWASQKPK